MRKTSIFILLIFALLLSACGDDSVVIEDEIVETVVAEEVDTEPENVVVYVCGEVCSPGIYYLNKGDRIADAIEAAGGFSEDADTLNLNLAGRLVDGQQIIVYGRKNDADDLSAENLSGKVNLNRADKEELMTLPGIGESKADDIIAYRESVGWISSTEEIMNINGIKEKMYEKIAGLIEV